MAEGTEEIVRLAFTQPVSGSKATTETAVSFGKEILEPRWQLARMLAWTTGAQEIKPKAWHLCGVPGFVRDPLDESVAILRKRSNLVSRERDA